jgi:hypothetical protein
MVVNHLAARDQTGHLRAERSLSGAFTGPRQVITATVGVGHASGPGIENVQITKQSQIIHPAGRLKDQN